MAGHGGACASSVALAPEAARDLYGYWQAIELADAGGDLRQVSFPPSYEHVAYPELAGRSPVYIEYFCPVGGPSGDVRRGTYDVAEGRLVIWPLWSDDGTGVGGMFASDFLAWDGNSFTIAGTTAASGERRFVKK